MSDRRRLAPAPALCALALLAASALGCTVTVDREEPAGPRPDERIERIRTWAEDAVEAGDVAGLSLGVEEAGELSLAEGFGLADIENDVPATERTVYRIGSITKQFTAALVMQLVEEGLIELDQDVRTVVDFPTGGRVVTVRQLLNHTSGIPSYTGLGETFWGISRLDLTHDELLALVRDLPLEFEPGAEYRYNNTGYYLLGVLLEEVSGRSYEDLLDERVFGPLGLEQTTYCGERKIIEHRAEGYERDNGQLLNDAPLSMKPPFAAGALCSTVLDLLAWQRALGAGEVVTPGSYLRMTSPGELLDGTPMDYGFGLGVGELEGHPRIAHGGGINGFASMLSYYPEADLRVVVLANTPGPTVGRLEERIARLLLGLEDLPEILDLPLSPEEAADYTGTYDLGQFELRVRQENGELLVRAQGPDETRLRYQGEDTFVPAAIPDTRLVFTREGNTVTGVVMLQGGTELTGPRIE